MSTQHLSPVVLTGHLEARLSRGLWLVKWLLLIPHAVVLFFLWVAVLALTVVAWFAILVTGRYPRSIFDFNVGVMRWSWRVWFYAYGALGTDRYPPFTLGAATDYPATLDVAYPERLSRGLVLVKSWLLAIPHYLVLGFFVGAGVAADTSGADASWPWSVGLVGVLVLIAAIVLLFTARYPRPVFDFVMGMDRWAARVAAYALLMTDAYPPFRLDQGGDEPSPPPPGPTGAGDAGRASAPVPTPAAHGWTALRIVSVGIGSVMLALAVGSGLGGGALLFADKALRDHDGFVTTSGEQLTTTSYAVATEEIHLDGGRVAQAFIGDVEVTVDEPEGPVFVGIAPAEAVRAYLRGVAHAVLTDVRDGTAIYRTVEGSAPTAAPGAAMAWAAQASGSGTQTLRWEPADGRWTAVLMNADGSAGVAAVVSAGATLPFLGWGAVTLLVAAGVLAIVGLVLLLIALPRSSRPAAASNDGAPPELTDVGRSSR